MTKPLTKKPLIYLFIYYCQRKKMGNKTGRLFCRVKDFRIRLSHMGIRKRLANEILNDMARYDFVKSVNFKNGMIEFKKTSDDAELFADMIKLREMGLI